MQMMQLSMYNRNVPKLEASTIMVRVFGRAASRACEVANHTLDQRPYGSAAIAASLSEAAPASPNTTSSAMQPITQEMIAKAQMARWGLRFLSCSMPKCSGTSWSLPIAYVTRAPVLMQESVVPIRARNTVMASINMNVRPLPWPNNALPTTIIMSPMGAAEPVAVCMV